MNAPTCRACWLNTLTPAQRERAQQEPITGCIYYCPDHRHIEDEIAALLKKFEHVLIRRPQ